MFGGGGGDDYADGYHYHQQSFLETMAMDARKSEIHWRKEWKAFYLQESPGAEERYSGVGRGESDGKQLVGIFTKRFQHSAHTKKPACRKKNICPQCQVTDITIRYAHVSHVGAGIQLATSISGNGKGGGDALAGTRWSIHDVVLDDLSAKYSDGGTVFEIANGWSKNPLNTVTINHITGFPNVSTHMLTIGQHAAKCADVWVCFYQQSALSPPIIRCGTRLAAARVVPLKMFPLPASKNVLPTLPSPTTD